MCGRCDNEMIVLSTACITHIVVTVRLVFHSPLLRSASGRCCHRATTHPPPSRHECGECRRRRQLVDRRRSSCVSQRSNQPSPRLPILQRLPLQHPRVRVGRSRWCSRIHSRTPPPPQPRPQDTHIRRPQHVRPLHSDTARRRQRGRQTAGGGGGREERKCGAVSRGQGQRVERILGGWHEVTPHKLAEHISHTA